MKILIDIPNEVFDWFKNGFPDEKDGEKAIEFIKKGITSKNLEEMHSEYSKQLWRNKEDVRGDDMIEIGHAEQMLQELLYEFGCWGEKENE